MKQIPLLLIGLFMGCSVLAQQANSLTADEPAALLKEMDSTRRADSITRQALLTKIENLHGDDTNSQRSALEQKLKEITRQDSVRRAIQQAHLKKLKASAKGFPVAPFEDTLFTIYTPIGSFTASDRANSITEKIEQLYENAVFIPDSLSIILSETGRQLVYKDMVVMSVTEMEALWLGVPQDSLARIYQEKIQQAIQEERKAHSSMNILLRIGAILLILLSVYVIIYLINIVFKMINARAISSKGRILKGIKVGGYQFLNSDQELKVVLIIFNGVRLFTILLAFSIALPLLFSVFPWTRGMAETLIDWVFSPLRSAAESVIDYLPNLVTIFIIGTITHFALKFFKFLAIEIERGKLKLPGFYPDWAKPTLNIVRLLIYAFSFILIWPYIPGSDSIIFQGVSVFFGILFSLGSSSAIANGVAGLVITYMRPFKVGDRVKIGEISGDVIEKSLLVTRIRTTKNENITVPNSTILAGATINYTTSAMESGLILYTSVTIGYDAPWRQVHELLINAAIATEGIMKDENHKPFVLQTSLDDFYVAYQINAYTDVPNRMQRIYSELHQNIQDKFNEAGVEIMSPHYRSERDGNMTTIPSDYLPKDYRAPMFNVNINTPKEE